MGFIRVLFRSQAPHLFKQLLMVAGFDRYYQIAKCFRDEDLRADRQPEFTQIDIETSFLDEADIIGITEGMIRKLFKEVLDLEFGEFPRMPFEEAQRRYGRTEEHTSELQSLMRIS